MLSMMRSAPASVSSSLVPLPQVTPQVRQGFTLAVKGENYGVYYKTNSPRGDKNTERVDRTQTTGIDEVEDQKSKSVSGEKFLKDGKLFIRCGEQVFDVTGNRVL